MDETLEEVALGRLGGAPCVLQLLVGREELPAAYQFEAGDKLLRLRL